MLRRLIASAEPRWLVGSFPQRPQLIARAGSPIAPWLFSRIAGGAPRVGYLRNLSTTTTPSSRPLRIERPLPELKNRRALKYLLTGVALVVWVAGTALAFNYQRQCSSAVTNTLFVVRYHPEVVELLGSPITFEHGWPWISGTINQLKGRVEISFRIKGPRNAGTVFVKTYRVDKLWMDHEFSLHLDDGKIINLMGHEGASLGSAMAAEEAQAQ
ncbi:cytochrome oxidase assembly protein 1 [Dispira parvispora]|uniref:Cytochrome oxidase assembly protein 1 n=1 Tax=Dispira parvispora TaxID=1520584 RepID=A0A9W8E4V7_9FUNG|nr:cytochrome oxidase assembly protein 1 [Dispira parvispora]